MTSIEAAILYAGLFIILFILLKVNVGRVRSAEKIIFGDGANERLQRAQRVQGNAVEDVPVTLIGIVGLGVLSAPVQAVHRLRELRDILCIRLPCDDAQEVVRPRCNDRAELFEGSRVGLALDVGAEALHTVL